MARFGINVDNKNNNKSREVPPTMLKGNIYPQNVSRHNINSDLICYNNKLFL